MREMVALVRSGVPYDTAAKWSRPRRLAWLVASAECDGLAFDWHRMEWRK